MLSLIQQPIMIIFLSIFSAFGNIQGNTDLVYSQTITNATTDYYATIYDYGHTFVRNGKIYVYDEGNPISKYMFIHTNYNQKIVAGIIYIAGISTARGIIPEPYNRMLLAAVSTAHFICGTTWSEARYFNEKNFTITTNLISFEF